MLSPAIPLNPISRGLLAYHAHDVRGERAVTPREELP